MKSERRTDERRATEKRRDFAELRAFIRKKRFEADVAEALKEQGIDDGNGNGAPKWTSRAAIAAAYAQLIFPWPYPSPASDSRATKIRIRLR